LLKPSRTYFHFYKKGFLNSQAVRIRVKKPVFIMDRVLSTGRKIDLSNSEFRHYTSIEKRAGIAGSARWHTTHVCSTVLTTVVSDPLLL
jgi:hypothetical protein